MCCWPRRWFIYYGYLLLHFTPLHSARSVSFRPTVLSIFIVQTKTTATPKKPSYNGKFTWAHTYRINNRHRHPSMAAIYCLYWIQKRCISIKIHCVNRGLNMMDLLHIKTKLNKMRNNNNNNKHRDSDSNQQWKPSTTEPFLLIDVQNQES